MDLYVDDSPYYAMRDYRDAVSRATDLGIYDPTHQLLEKLIEKINTI